MKTETEYHAEFKLAANITARNFMDGDAAKALADEIADNMEYAFQAGKHERFLAVHARDNKAELSK